MGRKTKKFINKNAKSCVTFSLVCPDSRDPRLQGQRATREERDEYSPIELDHSVNTKTIAAPVTSVLQRVASKNAAKKGKVNTELPKALRDALNPEYFGIHENLPTSKIVKLSEQVYGSVEKFPDDVKEKIIKSSMQSSRGKQSIDPDVLEKTDCYFPLDGYDYEQHLRVIRPEAVYASTTTETLKPPNVLTAEEEEVIHALEDADLYDGLSDTTLAEVLQGVDEEALLWGRPTNDPIPFRSHEEKEVLDQMLKASRDLHDWSSVDDDLSSDGCPCDDEMDRGLRNVLEEEYKEEDVGELQETTELGSTEIVQIKSVLDQYLHSIKNKSVRTFAPKHSTTTETVSDVLCGKATSVTETLEPLDARDREHLLSLAGTLENASFSNSSSCSDEEESEEIINTRWDCETILSTRSNLDNHPGRITRPSLKNVKPLPTIVEEVMKSRCISKVLSVTQATNANGTESRLADERSARPKARVTTGNSPHDSSIDSDDSFIELPAIITKRPPNETKEEKRQRKAAVKGAKRRIQKAKKDLASRLKEDQKKMHRMKMNSNDVHCGIRHFRL